MQIRKAARKKSKLRLGISGASGSGKTWSALQIATGMGGKIGMIDTESGRGELYGSDFNYDIIRLDAPYSPERYIEAIRTFEKSGCDVLIIDSLSHAWVGEGGILSIVDRAGNNSFTQGWKVATPKQNALIDAIITCKMHVIVTFRVKTEYVVEKNDRGKAEPRKVGLSPIQRDGLEYEFTLFMNINQEHIAQVTKDNTHLFDQQYIKPTSEMGIELMQWLESGVAKENLSHDETMIIEKFGHATNLNELKDMFEEANLYYPFLKEFINDAKDARKIELKGVLNDSTLRDCEPLPPAA